MFNKKLHLSQEDLQMKKDLQELGLQMRNKAKDSQAAAQAKIFRAYRATETGKRSAWSFVSRPFVITPVLVVAGLLLMVFVKNQVRYATLTADSYPSRGMELFESTGSASIAPESGPLGMDGGVGFAPQATEFVRSPLGYSERRTFKDRFLDSLGRHEAAPDEIAKRGPMFEQDLNARMITKNSDVVDEVEKSITSLKGYVSHIDRSLQNGTGYVSIQGQVPAEHLEAFRITLKSLAGNGKYYQERISAQSRTADMIAIEDETKKVENSITYLKDAIARETNLQHKADLERQLTVHEARLREREKTQASVSDRIEFADVYIDLTVLPSFWRTHSYAQMKMRFAGFNEPSITELFKINGSRVLVALLRLLSYTFWIIPFILLWWFKSYRAKGLLQELE